MVNEGARYPSSHTFPHWDTPPLSFVFRSHPSINTLEHASDEQIDRQNGKIMAAALLFPSLFFSFTSPSKYPRTMPTASHTIRNDTHQDNPSPETNPPRTVKPAALEIPELMENIFLFIDNETINTTVIYVCKPLSELEKVMSQLPRTTRLLVHLSNQIGHYRSQRILLRVLQDCRDYSLDSQPCQEQNASSTRTDKKTT